MPNHVQTSGPQRGELATWSAQVWPQRLPALAVSPAMEQEWQQALAHVQAPASAYAQCAGYEIHYMDWSPAAAPCGTVVAWHGLARTGRDMDPLARFLAAQGYRVICPDMLGRGLSQWSRRPEQDYQLSFYARLALALLDSLGLQHVHWLGTSMGGAMGMVAASGLFEAALKARITSLVLNDNAPALAPQALARIKVYAGQPPVFDTVAQLEQFLRQAYQPYGWLSERQWRQLTETSVRRLADGRITTHYDPQVMAQFTAHDNDYAIWPHYDALDIPVLLLRGEASDLVLHSTAQAMQERGPGPRGQLQWWEVQGCGHAPALNTWQQWQVVLRFLQSQPAQS